MDEILVLVNLAFVVVGTIVYSEIVFPRYVDLRLLEWLRDQPAFAQGDDVGDYPR